MLITAQLASGNFQSLFQGFLPTDLVQALIEAHGPARRRPPKLPVPDLVAGLVFHSLDGQGKFSTRVQELTGIELFDAAVSKRRAGLPFMVFEEIAAFLLGYAMLVEHRIKAAAAGQVPLLRISFRHTLGVVRTLWTTLALPGDLLSQAEQRLVV